MQKMPKNDHIVVVRDESVLQGNTQVCVYLHFFSNIYKAAQARRVAAKKQHYTER